MSAETITKTITIPRYTVAYDDYASAPDYCAAAPTIYGSEWWSHRSWGELTQCSCPQVEAPDWQTVKEALDHFGEHLQDLNRPDSLTARYLKAFHDVKDVQLIRSAVSQYDWAIVLDTYTWRDHVGLAHDAADVQGNALTRQYLDGSVYRVTDHLIDESLGGIYADDEAEALQVAKEYFTEYQEDAE